MKFQVDKHLKKEIPNTEGKMTNGKIDSFRNDSISQSLWNINLSI